MDVLIVLVFVSIVLVCGGILLMLVSLHQQDFEHAERLSLLPLQEPLDPLAATTTVTAEVLCPSASPTSSPSKP